MIGYRYWPKVRFDAELFDGEAAGAPHPVTCRTVQDVVALDAAFIAVLVIARRSNSKPCMRKISPRCVAGCPPPDSVMVVTDDPLPGRGQPAIQRWEVQHPTKPNCRSIR